MNFTEGDGVRNKHISKATVKLQSPVSIIASACIAGTKEGKGPLSSYYDEILNEDMYDEKTTHGWCHTVPNAMIVAMALLYGHGDYGTSICMAVQTGFDTDCNGATVGSVIGMLRGSSAIGEAWRKPVNDQVDTAILGVGRIQLRRAAEMTLKHLK